MIDKIVELCRQRGVVVPTIAQMKDPSEIPGSIRDTLADVGLWDIHPANLFRVSWKNEPVPHGGGFNQGNWIEFPPELTQVPARIIGLSGKWFPTGCPQGRRGIRLPGSAPRLRRGRPGNAEIRVAQHGKLLPRRRVRQCPAGLRRGRDPARGNVEGALRVAGLDRRPRSSRRRDRNRTSRRSTTSAGRSDDRDPTT